MISVSILKPEAALALPWEELRPFARNVFMDPVVLAAMSATAFADLAVLVAWNRAVTPARLVGLWALGTQRRLAIPYVEARPFVHGPLSIPVLHPQHAEAVMAAFLATIATDRTLPHTVVLHDLCAEGPEYAALQATLGGRASAVFRADQRPIATHESGIKRSGSTRKKLRQDWNRLAALGQLDCVDIREPAAVAEAFETFLALEAASWKGRRGTALLNDPRAAAFSRRLIADMAARGKASVALLTLDRKAIAAQVMLYCGRTAYTWKIAFDSDMGKFSPGMLVVDRISTALLDGPDIDIIDSCSRGDSFMAGLWSGRKPIVDMVVNARPGPSLAYAVIAAYFTGREKLKALRDRLRRRPAPVKKPAAAPASSPAAPAASAPAAPAAPTSGPAAPATASAPAAPAAPSSASIVGRAA